jgi:hypothetical protein
LIGAVKKEFGFQLLGFIVSRFHCPHQLLNDDLILVDGLRRSYGKELFPYPLPLTILITRQVPGNIFVTDYQLFHQHPSSGKFN